MTYPVCDVEIACHSLSEAYLHKVKIGSSVMHLEYSIATLLHSDTGGTVVLYYDVDQVLADNSSHTDMVIDSATRRKISMLKDLRSAIALLAPLGFIFQNAQCRYRSTDGYLVSIYSSGLDATSIAFSTNKMRAIDLRLDHTRETVGFLSSDWVRDYIKAIDVRIADLHSWVDTMFSSAKAES